MAEPSKRSFLIPLLQFIADWNTWPDVRKKMLDGEPECEMHYLVRIAAIIHALCLRDEVPIPDWVLDARLAEPEIIENKIRVSSNYGKLVIAESHDVCEHHNVFFEAEMLDKGSAKQRFHPILENGEPWLATEDA